MRNLEELYNLCDEVARGEFGNYKVDDIKELASVSKVIIDYLIGFADNHGDENLANASVTNQRDASVTLSNIFEELEYYTEE